MKEMRLRQKQEEATSESEFEEMGTVLAVSLYSSSAARLRQTQLRVWPTLFRKGKTSRNCTKAISWEISLEDTEDCCVKRRKDVSLKIKKKSGSWESWTRRRGRGNTLGIQNGHRKMMQRCVDGGRPVDPGR